MSRLRRRPELGLALALPLLVYGGAEGPAGVFFLAAIAVAFAVGRWGGRPFGPAGTLMVIVASAASTGWNNDDFVPVILFTASAGALGCALAERSALTRRLAERGEELESERDAYAHLSVRYERARIASELHDIVAHAISVMVVQASAGQRVAVAHPELAAETFAAIGGAAREAEADIARLVALLSDEEAIGPAPDLALVEELVARAAGSGLDVTLRLAGEREGLPAVVVQTAYRVVQEGVTNALRYASGAQVGVALEGRPGVLTVEVVNGPGRGGNADIDDGGTGNGLRGLRERVTACGGRLEAGPLDAGGWRLAATIPAGEIADTSSPARESFSGTM